MRDVAENQAWTVTDLRLLGFIDWDVVLGDIPDFDPPPTGAELGERIQAAATAAFDPAFRPHRDLLDSVRERLADLAHALHEDAEHVAVTAQVPHGMRARIGAGAAAVIRMDLSKALATAAKEIVGKGQTAYKATVIGGVALAHPAAAIPVLLGAAAVGTAKEVIDAFQAGLHSIDSDLEHAELAAHTHWVDQCLQHLAELANRGQISRVETHLRLYIEEPSVLGHLSALSRAPAAERYADSFWRDFRDTQRWAARTSATLFLLWDLLGAEWGRTGSTIIDQITEPLGRIAYDLNLAEEAIGQAELSAAADHIRDALKLVNCLDDRLTELGTALFANRLTVAHPPPRRV
jgi:hypothetical protein